MPTILDANRFAAVLNYDVLFLRASAPTLVCGAVLRFGVDYWDWDRDQHRDAPTPPIYRTWKISPPLPVAHAPSAAPLRHLPNISPMWTYLHAHQRAINAPSACLQAPPSVLAAPPCRSPLHVPCRLCPMASALAASSVQQPDVDLPPRPSTHHQCAVSTLASAAVSARRTSPPLPIARALSAAPHGICTGGIFRTAAQCGLTSTPINAPSMRRQQACKRRCQCPPPRHSPLHVLRRLRPTASALAASSVQQPDVDLPPSP
ncbi:hypothetical protein C8J57DRAFT_1242960 [Mycena rebaudengoi]|nr:hypothetical protein C8J57DRAFT_1242960 [Mycena rebaudengoi]